MDKSHKTNGTSLGFTEMMGCDKMGYICCSPLKRPSHDSRDMIEPAEDERRADGQKPNKPRQDRNSASRTRLHDQVNQNKSKLGPSPNVRSPSRPLNQGFCSTTPRGPPWGEGLGLLSCYFEFNDVVFSNSGAEEMIL